MKKLIWSFLMVIGITISAFSQTTYPKKILLGRDTVLAITKSQLVAINRGLNDYIHLKRSYNLLQVDLVASDSLGLYWREVSYKKDNILLFEREKFLESTRYIESLQESLKQQKKKSRNITLGVGVGGTLLGIILGVLLK